MEIKGFNDILSELSRSTTLVRKNQFVDLLNRFIDQRYYEIENEVHRSPRLAEDYARILEKTTSERKKISRLLTKQDEYTTANTSTINVSREFIIHLSFVLVSERKDEKGNPVDKDGKQITFVEIKDQKGKTLSGLEICNLLLKSLGYYRLPASSITEFVYYYSLKNNKTFKEHQKIEAKVEALKKKGSLSPSSHTGNTSFYRNMVDNVNNDDAFIETMSEIASNLEANSKWLTDLFGKTWKEIYKKLNGFSIDPTTQISSDDVWCFSEEILLPSVDFFHVLNSSFPYSPISKKALSEELASEKLKPNKKDSDEKNYSKMNQYFESKDAAVRIIKGNAKKGNANFSGAYSFSALHKNIFNIIFEKDTIISREGFCLWLLYAYPDLKSEEIDKILQKRFDVLNKDVYFDRFVTYVSNFYLQENRVYYKDVLSEEEEAKTYLVKFDEKTIRDIQQDDPCSFRKRILSKFVLEHADKIRINFINNKNSVIV